LSLANEADGRRRERPLLYAARTCAAIAPNEQTIRRYLREGRLQGIRLGTRWLITDADLQLFLWESRADAKEEERP
jgi:hypothetical protein